MPTKMSAAELLQLLGSYICTNQLYLAHYIFLSSKKHKELKEVLQLLLWFEQSNDPSEDLDLITTLQDEMRLKLAELDLYLGDGINDIFKKTFGYAERYFEDRVASGPRLCIKVINENELFVLAREPAFKPSDPTFLNVESSASLTENSAFEVISSGERYYLCNNIPSAFEAGEYKNSRLDKESVSRYNVVASNGDITSEELNRLWVKCWKLDDRQLTGKKHDFSKDEELFKSFYRSTLVVPMSFKNGDIDKDFKEKFGIREDTQRLILGFLCFDHENENLFNSEEDVCFGYILADMLSLYLLQQFTCTQFSTAYYEARQYLSRLT
jgi:hypothetical protein